MPAQSDTLSAAELILALLDSAPRPELTAASLVAAGDLLGIDARAVRVAAARLVKQKVLASAGRGRYSVGERGRGLHRRVLTWTNVERTLKPWRGDWLAVYLAHLKRGDKTALRARERALRLAGFATVDAGLHARPANLKASTTGVRDNLLALGLDPDACVLHVAELEPHGFIDPQALWDTAALERGYAEWLRELADSTRRVPAMDVESAARETLLVGRAVLKVILADPLLPGELIDARQRGTLIDAMKSYDALGKRCWREFYRALGSR